MVTKCVGKPCFRCFTCVERTPRRRSFVRAKSVTILCQERYNSTPKRPVPNPCRRKSKEDYLEDRLDQLYRLRSKLHSPHMNADLSQLFAGTLRAEINLYSTYSTERSISRVALHV